MSAPFRTDLRACQRDVAQAHSFRDRADAVHRARNAIMTVELLWEDAGNPGAFGADAARRLGITNYTMLVLTEEPWNAVYYTVRPRGEVDALFKGYCAGFETVPA